MEGRGAGARIADSSAFAICGVNLFQLRAGVTESHDCHPGLRLSGNLRELQSSFNGSWRFLTDGGKAVCFSFREPEVGEPSGSPCLNVATIHVCFTRAREHSDRRRSTFPCQHSRSQSQQLQESLRQEADPRRVGELEADSSDGENRRTVAAE